MKLDGVQEGAAVGNKQTKVQVNAKDLPDVQCECGCTVFMQAQKVKRLSKMHPQNPTGQDSYLHIGVAVCVDCKKTLEPVK